MLPEGPGSYYDPISNSVVNLRRNVTVQEPGVLFSTGSYNHSTMVAIINRCLSNGSKVRVGLVSIQSFVLSEFTGDSAIIVPDSEIDPLGDIIAEPGAVRGWINASSDLLGTDGFTLDR